MKYLLIFIALIFSTKAFSQLEATKQSKRMSYGIYLSPTISYRTLTTDTNLDLVKEIRNNKEVAGIGYRVGITFDYRITNKLEVQSGLILSNRVFKTSEKDLVWSETDFINFSESFISHQYLYMDIPLKLKYNIMPQRRFNVFVSGGVNTALFFLYNRKNHVKNLEDWEITKDQSFNLNSINILAEIESGIEYKINSKLKFRSALNFIHAFTPTNSNLNTKEYLYSGGLSVGLILTPNK